MWESAAFACIVGGGGVALLAVMKERNGITGSGVLYERDREGFTKTELRWKRGSQSERDVRQPLERTLRLTPSHSLPFSICKYPTSPEDVFDLFSFFSLLKKLAVRWKYVCFALITWQPVAGWGEVQPEPSSFSFTSKQVWWCFQKP